MATLRAGLTRSIGAGESNVSIPSRPLPSYKELSSRWRYDPDTGKFYWKIKPIFSTVKIGEEAGGISGGSKGKYWRLNLNGRVLQGHRVAWMLHYGEDPGQLLVDHINGDGLDNRICNLRLATPRENGLNRKTYVNNTTGHRGVHPSGRIGKPYVGRIYHGYRTQVVGYFETAEEAAAAVDEARRKFHGQFYADR